VWAVALLASSKSLIVSTSWANWGWHVRMEIPRCALEKVGTASPGLKLRLTMSFTVCSVKKGALSMSLPVSLLPNPQVMMVGHDLLRLLEGVPDCWYPTWVDHSTVSLECSDVVWYGASLGGSKTLKM